MIYVIDISYLVHAGDDRNRTVGRRQETPNEQCPMAGLAESWVLDVEPVPHHQTSLIPRRGMATGTDPHAITSSRHDIMPVPAPSHTIGGVTC